NGTITTPEQAAQFFDAIDRMDHNGDPGSVDSDTAVKLAEEARQMAALQQLHPPFSTEPSEPSDPAAPPAPVQTDDPDAGGPVGAFQLAAGAQSMQVLSALRSTPRFHAAPFNQPLTGLKSYAQITKDGQTAAQFLAKADYDSDGSSSFRDSGTHSDDTSMHFR